MVHFKQKPTMLGLLVGLMLNYNTHHILAEALPASSLVFFAIKQQLANDERDAAPPPHAVC